MRLELAVLVAAFDALACPKNDPEDQKALIPAERQQPQTPPTPKVPAPVADLKAPPPTEYLACGCGCCGTGTPKVVCVETAKGQTIEAVIAKDQADRQQPICEVAGCGLGVLYKDCGAAPPGTTR